MNDDFKNIDNVLKFLEMDMLSNSDIEYLLHYIHYLENEKKTLDLLRKYYY